MQIIQRIRAEVRKDVAAVLHLPLVERITHKRVRRHLKGLSGGIGVMLIASTMAVNGEAQHLIPHALWDATAYFLHGCGTVPVMIYIEPLWSVFLGESGAGE